jgi:hypothetical protein
MTGNEFILKSVASIFWLSPVRQRARRFAGGEGAEMILEQLSALPPGRVGQGTANHRPDQKERRE